MGRFKLVTTNTFVHQEAKMTLKQMILVICTTLRFSLRVHAISELFEWTWILVTRIAILFFYSWSSAFTVLLELVDNVAPNPSVYAPGIHPLSTQAISVIPSNIPYAPNLKAVSRLWRNRLGFCPTAIRNIILNRGGSDFISLL